MAKNLIYHTGMEIKVILYLIGENKIINYSQIFNLTKYDATDNLTVHIFTNKGKEIIIEYEKSE